MAPTFDITIDTIGARGDGVGRLPDGRKVFVSAVLPGENVQIEPGETTQDGVRARLINVIESSPDRIAPPCRHFESCGGCVLQHMNEASYRCLKMEQVTQILSRNGIMPAAIEGPFISAPGSRRRAVMAAYRDHTQFVLGFNEQRSNKIVDIAECPVLSPRLVAVVPQLRATISKILQPGQGMDIAVMESNGDIDMVLRPWTKKKTHDDLPMFMLERLSAFAEAADIARLSWQNSADDESDLTQVSWRKPFTVDFSGTIVTPPPGAFLQATRDGEAALIKAVIEGLPKKGKIKAIDLYAGCGTFTFALSALKHKVHAVEGFAPALNALKVAMPGRPVTAEKRDLARDPLMHKELNEYNVAVIDPPRIGAAEQVKMLARSDVPTLIYVSCSAASFAKDAEILTDKGFKLQKLTVVDQFLWSPHVELVGIFRR